MQIVLKIMGLYPVATCGIKPYPTLFATGWNTNNLISYNQNAFIPGRNILESSLLAYKMTRSFNRKTSKKTCIKVDLQKAYDEVSKEFITYVMVKMGFPPQFVFLVQWCISTPTFSIIINGTPQGFINNNRGIQRGDPLSSYLFAIIMEYLSTKMESEHLLGNINPISNIINHFYADELLIFSKANLLSATTIKSIFVLQAWQQTTLNPR